METPLLRVSRPVSACARCRNAKIRCDGKLPACSACERAGKSSECSSANDVFAKGKERSYVASLELRIERLEKQIAQTRAQKAGGLQSQQNLATNVIAYAKRPSQITEASDVDELVSDFGYLVLNATSTGYNGFDKEMSFARLAISTATVKALRSPAQRDLPPRETTIVLIQECMQNVFSIYPVLTETSIYGSVESVYQHNGQYSSPSHIWNLRLVMAIGLLSRSRIKDDVDYENACRHVAIALEQAETVLQPGITETTQALLLLSIYSILDPAHFNSWYLLSIAIRVWLDIGLHQEPAHLKRPPRVAQSHRRLFYCMYSLDRVITFSHLRLFSFTDDAFDVDLPDSPVPPRFKDVDSTTDIENETGGLFILLTKFRQAESQHYQKLFGSRRDMLYEPWYNRPQDIVALKVAYSELTHNAREAQRNVLSLDLHYLTVLLLRPLENQVDLDPYGKHLLFDASMLYAEMLHWLLQWDQFSICCTSLELLRATRVAQYLMAMLRDNACPVFEETAPREPPSLLGNQLPTIVKRTPMESVSAVVGFCVYMEYALDVLGQRFGRSRDHYSLLEEISTNLRVFGARQKSYQVQASNADHRDYHQVAQSYNNGAWQTYHGSTHENGP